MYRVAWLTDIHLNFLEPTAVYGFFDRVSAERPDAVLIGGDIGEGPSLVAYLERIERRLRVPVYFVLGNHDYYFGSIRAVRARVQELCGRSAGLTWLPAAGVVELTDTVGLVGHGGWGDGRAGDYAGSTVMLNDYLLIEELAGYQPAERLPTLQELGDEAAAHIRRVLPAALEANSEVLLLTHVPPLREACWHEGRTSDDNWAPHFTCQAMGEAILEIMRGWPERKLTVLCGHTHGAGECRPLENVVIYTGGAVYGEPRVERVFELGGEESPSD